MALARIMKYNFSFILCLVSLVSFSVEFCSCKISKHHNVSLAINNGFSAGFATFYGDPFGAGSVRGACGYGDAVAHPPYSAFVSAGNSNDLYKGGSGCGACYQVKCTSNAACSGAPVTVTITDECPGDCNLSPFHFDLSWTAMNAMAKPGQGDKLRAAGQLNIEYQRVTCNYRGPNIAFRVDQGANGFFFAFVTEYVSGDGTLGLVELQPANSGFLPMTRNFGASWKLNSPTKLRGPFSIRITTLESRRQATAVNVIPANWVAGQTYISNIF